MHKQKKMACISVLVIVHGNTASLGECYFENAMVLESVKVKIGARVESEGFCWLGATEDELEGRPQTELDWTNYLCCCPP